MTTCLGKSCSFGLLCVYLVTVNQVVCAPFLSSFEARMWDLVLLVPDRCISC